MKILRLIRWPNCLIAGLTVMCGIILLPELPPTAAVILAIVCAISLTALGNIDNDLADIQSDKINHPNRPLAYGTITKTTAIALLIIFSIISLVTAFLLNSRCFLIVVSAVILLLTYNHALKRVPLLSNIIIALIGGMAFIFAGSLDVGFNIMEINLLTSGAIIAFLFHLGREIIKDLQDREGDIAVKIKTFANSVVLKYVKLFVGSIFLILFVYVIFMIQFLKLRIVFCVSFLFGVVIPLIVLACRFWNNDSNKSYHFISIALKILMPIGLLTLLLARFGI